MNDASPARHDKFRRYRERKKAQGLREVRLWTLDVNAPGFRDAVERQAAAIRASEVDREITADMQLLTDEVWAKIP